MKDLENFISKNIKKLVPNYDIIELKATITSSSLSVEFFATVNGKKNQCFQMIDDGLFTEEDFNKFSKDIANYARKLPDFNKEGLNKYTIKLK